MVTTSGFSGNEMLCLSELGFAPGDLVLGNSVIALGVQGGIQSAFSTMAGGEVKPVTKLIKDARTQAFERMSEAAKHKGVVGIAGINLDLVQHLNCQEVLCMGSLVKGENENSFSAASDGQDLYCQIDAGYWPVKFAFGNVAYSIGFANAIAGSIHSLGKGEVKEFSQVLYQTRELALARLLDSARESGANSVLGIQTIIRPFLEIQEMMMVGTASFNENLPPECTQNPVSSSLSNSELWSLTKLGYAPVQLLIGVSVYSLGIAGSIAASIKQVRGGEINELSDLICEAREEAITKMKESAQQCGAKRVVGLKTYVFDLGAGMIEFFTIGTAVVKVAGLKTESEILLPQALMHEQDRERASFQHVKPISAHSGGSSLDTISAQNTDAQLVDGAVNYATKKLPKEIMGFLIPFSVLAGVMALLLYLFFAWHR